jgi:hypothetical protein
MIDKSNNTKLGDQNYVARILFFQVPFKTGSPLTYTVPFPLAKSFTKNPLNRCPFVRYIVPGPSLHPSEKLP